MHDIDTLTLNFQPEISGRRFGEGEFNAFDYLDSVGELLPDQAQRAMVILNDVLDHIDYTLCDQKKLPRPDVAIKLDLALNIGGYFRPGADYIVINPLALLYGTTEEVFRILQHEINHYSGILDESATDLLAELQMEERRLDSDTNAGYPEQITLLKRNLPNNISTKEIVSLITNDDQETLCNFIEKILIDRLINNRGYMGPEAYRKAILGEWHIIQELFPRLLNTLFAPERGLHKNADNVLPSTEVWNILWDRFERKCLNSELNGATVAKES